jgi:hypothetical protein
MWPSLLPVPCYRSTTQRRICSMEMELNEQPATIMQCPIQNLRNNVTICKYMQIYYANILQRFITRPTLAKNPWTRHRCPEVLFWLWQINQGYLLTSHVLVVPCSLYVACLFFPKSSQANLIIYPHVATVWQCNVLAQVHHVNLPSKVPSLCWCFITWHFR